MILLLSPAHGSPEYQINRTVALFKIEQPVVTELEPRAGMRRFQILSVPGIEPPSNDGMLSTIRAAAPAGATTEPEV